MGQNREIPSEEAKEIYHITSPHGEMDNGEFRFRLYDIGINTSYILTKANENSGWQESHFHQGQMETYIVQAGWMVLAEFVDEKVILKTYSEGQSFTTSPFVIHNVFLAPNSVIHTVKHGVAPNRAPQGDINTNKDTIKLDKQTEQLSLEFLSNFKEFSVTQVSKLQSLNSKSNSRSDDYRHFDMLIWQVPAVAAAYILGFATLIKSLLNGATSNSKFDTESMAMLPWAALLSWLFISLLSFTMLRFRINQISGMTKEPWKLRFLLNPQVGLQFLINIIGAIFAAVFFNYQHYWVDINASTQIPYLIIPGAVIFSLIEEIAIGVIRTGTAEFKSS